MREESAQDLLLRGLERLREERWDEAGDLLEAALAGLRAEEDPALVVLCLEGLERVADADDRPALALRVVRERERLAGVLAADSPREEAGRCLDRAGLLLDLGRYAEAEREAGRALELLPAGEDRAGATAYRGLSLLKQGEAGAALEALAAELPHLAGEGVALVYALQGVALCQQGRHREAVPVLEAALDRFRPDGGEALIATLSLAQALAGAGEKGTAVARLLELADRSGAPVHLRAEAYLQAAGIAGGGWEAATGRLTEGLAAVQGHPPQDQAAYANLLQVCAEMDGRAAESRRWFRHPGDPGRSPFKLEALAAMALGLAEAGPDPHTAGWIDRALDLLAGVGRSSQLAILVDRARERLGAD